MQYTKDEKYMLDKVNEIGLELDKLPEENFVFVVLSPYLDQLMELLKRLNSSEMQFLFFKYRGVMNVMKMIENEAQKIVPLR
jgi:hypothetical protein